MFEYIKAWYGVIFSARDLPGFVSAGWITQAQANELTTMNEVTV